MSDHFRQNRVELLSDESSLIPTRPRLKIKVADLNPHQIVKAFGGWPDVFFQAHIRGGVVGYAGSVGGDIPDGSIVNAE